MGCPTHRRRLMMYALLLACLAIVLAHALSGHGHPDALTTVPLEHHIPGDAHHDLTGGSCEVLRASVVVDAILPASAAGPGADLDPARLLTMVTATPTVPVHGPPIFLLHAALLI